MQSNQIPSQHRSRRRLAFLALACSAVSAHAIDTGGVAIHGSLSTTASYSPDYNYLGDTKESLDLNQVELILNGTKRFDNGIKLAAQIYAYELAGYEDLTVDFANLDYSFRQEIGVRAGRNKVAAGFYNESQDLDQVRIFASLPLNFYPRATRAFGAYSDGVTFYGNLPAGKAGGFDYQVFAGVVQPLDEEQPFIRGSGISQLEPNIAYGASLVWNTAVEGLRAGYTHQFLPCVDANIGPVVSEIEYTAQIASVEYTRGRWTATAEYKRTTNQGTVTNLPVPPSTTHEDHAYVQLTCQATDKLGLGVYYAYSDFEATGVDKDIALAGSYALQPWWLVKAEVHLMDGINNLGNAGDINPGATDETWTYFVLKSTLSF